MHNSARVFSLHQACYELRICQHPTRQARPGQASIAQRVQAISQPAIRAAALRYLATVAATLRPNTVSLRADSLIVFCEYLAAARPDVRSLTQLTREHVEGFLAHNHKRPWRGRLARDQAVSAAVSKRTVIDLRCFLDDLAPWGWAERPPRRLLFPADIPRLDRPLPRAPPDADRDLMAAIGELADPFARTGLMVLRGTGIRLGELLDLELDCIWDSASHGSWLKVPLGKLATERTVPLDEPALAALDEWMTRRGPQRALPHPRNNRPADFLFTDRGRRLGAWRLRRGLDDAAAAAGLRGRDGQTMHVTPHQLRHTYATTLPTGFNSGMSLQALMALLGHVSTEMTLRYAALAAPAVRTAYEEAMGKARTRLALAIAPAGCNGCAPRCSRPGSRTATAPASSPPRPAPTPTSASNATTTSPRRSSSRSSRPSSPTSPPSATTPPHAAGTPKSPGTHASSPASRATSSGSPGNQNRT